MRRKSKIEKFKKYMMCGCSPRKGENLLAKRTVQRHCTAYGVHEKGAEYLIGLNEMEGSLNSSLATAERVSPDDICSCISIENGYL